MKKISILIALATLSALAQTVNIISPPHQGTISFDASGNLNFVLAISGTPPANLYMTMGMVNVLQQDSDPQCAALTSACAPFTQLIIDPALFAPNSTFSARMDASAARNGILNAGTLLVFLLSFDPTTGAIGEYQRYSFQLVGPGTMSTGIADVSPPNTDSSDAITIRPGSKIGTRLVKTSRGDVEVKRGDQINIGDFQYTFYDSGGQTVYNYSFDTNGGAARFRVSDQTGRSHFTATAHGEPKGWLDAGDGAWAAFKNPTYGPKSEFSVTSDWLPGLVPVFFQSDVSGITAMANGGQPTPLPNLSSKDNQRLIATANIFRNSLKRYAIGPAFEPGASKERIAEEIRIWVEQYGFSFLKPLVGAENLQTLNSVTPSNQLESDIVDCLRRVLH